MPEPHNEQAQASEEVRREPYQTPQLNALGSITELTQAIAGNPTDGNMGTPGSQI